MTRCVAHRKGLFREEELYIENYLFTEISTKEFSPEYLRKGIFLNYWYFNFRLPFARPVKFFTKYFRRIFQKEVFKAITRSARYTIRNSLRRLST